MARKAASNELTKEMIIEVADRQFMELDYNKVSMRAIAKELNCSHGAIYYHFKDKTDLFDAVVEKYFNILNLDLHLAIENEPLVGTRMVLMGYIKFGLTYPSQYDFMFVKRADGLDPLAQPAPIESYKKFQDTLQSLNSYTLNASDIHSTFMSLHGFVLCYKGRIKAFTDIKDAVCNHCEYLVRALVR